jgi:hypothetical protein
MGRIPPGPCVWLDMLHTALRVQFAAGSLAPNRRGCMKNPHIRHCSIYTTDNRLTQYISAESVPKIARLRTK